LAKPEINTLQSQENKMSDNFFPIGSVLPYAGGVSSSNENQLIQAGYIPCDGRGLSLTDPDYSALKSVIGNAYGADANLFYVPDYRGRFLRGVDDKAGNDPDANSRTAPRPDLPLGDQGNTGDAVGSLQGCQIRSHSHTYSMHTGSHKCNYGSLIGPGVFTGGTAQATSSSTGGLETRPVNLYVNYVIRYK
jgi:microcystin-dependent protein